MRSPAGCFSSSLKLVSRGRLACCWHWKLRLRLISCSKRFRRLGATNCHCAVFRWPLSRKTAHKITCNHCWLSDLEPHTGRCCPGQLSDHNNNTNIRKWCTKYAVKVGLGLNRDLTRPAKIAINLTRNPTRRDPRMDPIRVHLWVLLTCKLWKISLFNMSRPETFGMARVKYLHRDQKWHQPEARFKYVNAVLSKPQNEIYLGLHVLFKHLTLQAER